MKQSPNKIHPGFKLNGISYSAEELKEVGYSLIKEGEDYEIAIGDFLLDWLSENPMIAVRTSGSTGIPKEIRVQKQFMRNSAEATASFFGLKAGTTALNCLPSNYISGKMMLVRALVMGWELDCIAPSSTPMGASSKAYDFCAMIPLQVQNSLAFLDRIKTLIIGGAPVPEVLRKQLQQKVTACYETYGMTESVSHIALKRTHSKNKKDANFKTLEGIRVSKDERDCLVIEAPGIAANPIVTNDVVELISDSEFSWLGRYDNVVNSGGVKLIPEHIEKKLLAHISVPFFLAGLKDDILGEKLVLVTEEGYKSDHLLEKIKSLKGLSKFEIPKEVVPIKQFERTETGKLRRKEMIHQLRKN